MLIFVHVMILYPQTHEQKLKAQEWIQDYLTNVFYPRSEIKQCVSVKTGESENIVIKIWRVIEGSHSQIFQPKIMIETLSRWSERTIRRLMQLNWNKSRNKCQSKIKHKKETVIAIFLSIPITRFWGSQAKFFSCCVQKLTAIFLQRLSANKVTCISY